MAYSLADERYINLTTFKRDGTSVSTPVWIVSDDAGRLLVWSGVNTWKVKRIRRDPRVLVGPASFRGKERGPKVEGRAHVVADPGIDRLLRRKYGWQKRFLDVLNRRTTSDTWAVLEISLREPGAAH